MNKFCELPRFVFFCLGLWFSFQVSLLAALELGVPFTENMVVQHDKPLTVWGWDRPNQTVVVEFDGVRAKTVTKADGSWELNIETPDAGGPYTFEVRGSEAKTFENVLSGEVWLASGQSNMGWPLRKTWKSKQRINNANFPEIRFLKMSLISEDSPQDRVNSDPWIEISPKTAGNVSGVAYFFAHRLYHDLDMPIGIIQSAWGGSKIQGWLPKEVIENENYYEKIWDVYEERKITYEKALSEWKKGGEEGTRPGPMGGGPQHKPSGLDNGMIHPLQPYAIKGAIWYQGESDAWNPDVYRKQFRLLVEAWRERFRAPDMPVYFCQLPNYKNNWTRFRLAQAKIPAELPNTDYAVLIGAGDKNDIHPRNKITPGSRLAQLALAHDYGFDIVPGGPIPVSAVRKRDRVEIEFKQIGEGLEIRQKEGNNSQIVLFAGEERVLPQSIKIEGNDTIVLELPSNTPSLNEVRYATYANPWAEVFNKDGFPGTPFVLPIQ